MKDRTVYDRCRSKLAKEGIIKACIAGFGAGFAVDAVMAVFFWFFAVKAWWISIIAGVVVAVAVALLTYFLVYRPVPRAVAQRLDSLGADERFITAFEYRNDDSFIARHQREDAENVLNVAAKRYGKKIIAFVIPTALIVSCAVSSVIGISMTTVSALGAEGVIGTGKEVASEIINTLTPDQFVSVEYNVEEGGYIEGEIVQVVLKGDSAETVVAVAEDGWMFSAWSDGYTDPSRTDENIQEDLEITAVFVEIEYNDGEGMPGEGEGEGEGEGAGEGEGPSDAPGEGNGEGSGEGASGEGNGEGEGEGEGDGEGDGAAGGITDDNDKIIDGKTDYRELYEYYYQLAMEYLSSGKEMPDYLRAIIEAYYQGLL